MKQEIIGFWVAVASASFCCCQSAPRFRQTTTPTHHHSISTGRMLFPMPNQQCQNTENWRQRTSLCLISMQVLARLRVGELTKHNVVKCCLWPWGDSIAANGNNKTVHRYHISPPFCCCQMIAQFNYTQHRRRKGSVVGGDTMASAEHEPMMGVWGQSPLKLKAFWSLDVQRSRQI